MILLLSVLSAIFYRAGGMSKDSQEPLSKWIPKWLRHSWVRDWLCPACVVLTVLGQVNAGNWYWLLPAYGATGGMLTTYWDWLFKYDNFWFSGFMVGVAGMFLIGIGTPWMLILARSVALAVLWGFWCKIFGNADIEEYGRGAFLVLTTIIIGGR